MVFAISFVPPMLLSEIASVVAFLATVFRCLLINVSRIEPFNVVRTLSKAMAFVFAQLALAYFMETA